MSNWDQDILIAPNGEYFTLYCKNCNKAGKARRQTERKIKDVKRQAEKNKRQEAKEERQNADS